MTSISLKSFTRVEETLEKACAFNPQMSEGRSHHLRLDCSQDISVQRCLLARTFRQLYPDYSWLIASIQYNLSPTLFNY